MTCASPEEMPEELIARFEGGAIAASSFHHVDHVQLAFAYLVKYPVLEALGKFVSALQRFASAQGKPGLYNETVTFAYFFLIRERMARRPSADWTAFAQQNSDLLVWKNGVLSLYYSDATLNSELAKKVFVFPEPHS